MKNHCVGHLLIKTIGVDELSNRRVIIRELGSSFNGDDAIDVSVVVEGKTEASSFTTYEITDDYVSPSATTDASIASSSFKLYPNSHMITLLLNNSST